MRKLAIAVVVVLLVGCVQQPIESSTEQATLSETQARIAATNAVIAYEAQQCTEAQLCAPDSFGFVDCGGSQDGMTCCFWYFCCTVWYLGDLSCAWYGG